jgi:hypothetical protein
LSVLFKGVDPLIGKVKLPEGGIALCLGFCKIELYSACRFRATDSSKLACHRMVARPSNSPGYSRGDSPQLKSVQTDAAKSNFAFFIHHALA